MAGVEAQRDALPELGDTVIYVAREPEGVERAAIVTGVNSEDETIVDLMVFVNEGRELHEHVERFALDVPYGSGLGTWHWPGTGEQ